MDPEVLEIGQELHVGLRDLKEGVTFYQANWPKCYIIGYLAAAIQLKEKKQKNESAAALGVPPQSLLQVYQKFFESKGLRVRAVQGKVKYRNIGECARYKPPAEEPDPADDLGLPALAENMDFQPLLAQLRRQRAHLQDIHAVMMNEKVQNKEHTEEHTEEGPASARKRLKISSTASAAAPPPFSSLTHEGVLPPLPPQARSAGPISPSAEHPHPHHQCSSAAFAFPSAEHHQLPAPRDDDQHQHLGFVDDDDQQLPALFPQPQPPLPPLRQPSDAPAQQQKRKRWSTKTNDIAKEYYGVFPRPNSEEMEELPGFTLAAETMIKRLYHSCVGIPMSAQWMKFHKLDTPIGPFDTFDRALHDKIKYPRVLMLHSTSQEGLKGILESRRFRAKVGGDDAANNRHGYFSTSPEVLFRWAKPYHKGKGKRGVDSHQYVVHMVFEVILDPSRGAEYIIYSGCTSDTIKSTQEGMDAGIMRAVGYLEIKVPQVEDGSIYEKYAKAVKHVGFFKPDGTRERYNSKAELEAAAPAGSMVSNIFRRLLVAPGSRVTRKQLMAFNPGTNKQAAAAGLGNDADMDID